MSCCIWTLLIILPPLWLPAVASSITKTFYGSRKSRSTERGRGRGGTRRGGGGLFDSSSQVPQDMFQSGDSDLVSPLHGIEVGFDQAQELAHQVDTLRAEGQVKLLNFAFLSLNKSQLLGVGSFSKVSASTVDGCYGMCGLCVLIFICVPA